MKFFWIMEEDEVCANCVHYMQHYVRFSEGSHIADPCMCGHCMYPNLKHRKPDDTCENFERR